MTEQAAPQADIAKQVLAVSQRIGRIVRIAHLEGSHRIDADKVLGLIRGKKQLDILEGEGVPSVAAVEGNQLRIDFEFELDGVDPADEKKPLIEVRAKFVILYELTEGPEIPRQVLDAFATVNPPFNLTPFWREYVQTCFVRAGLPPYSIAPFNAVKAIEELKKQKTPTAAE